MIQWGQIASLGIKEIDEEHKIFFDIVERATRLVDNNPSVEDVCQLIIELKGYVDVHFEDEEKIMKDIMYPDITEHVLEHLIFKSQIEEINTTIIEHDRKAYLLNMMDFIVEWVILHIGKDDVKLAKYYLEHKDE